MHKISNLLKMKGNLKILSRYGETIYLDKGPSLYYVSKGTELVGSEKCQFLLTFITIYANVGWVGADVIDGWSLKKAQFLIFRLYN